MAPHCSTLAWKIPWMEEPGGLQSTGLLRVRHDWATSLLLFTIMHWRRKWQPTPVFLCLENTRDGGAWWAAVYGVAQSRTRLKRLSSSSSSSIQPIHQEDGNFGPDVLIFWSNTVEPLALLSVSDLDFIVNGICKLHACNFPLELSIASYFL